MRRRLASPGQIERWHDRLGDGLRATVDTVRHDIGGWLASHGVAWSDPATSWPSTGWDQDAWARAVAQTFTPIAVEVAAEIAVATRGHFPDNLVAGIPDGSVDAYARVAVERALAAGVKIGGSLGARAVGLVAAGGNIASIRSALDDATDAMAGLVGRTGNQMVNAAGVDAADAVSAATGQVVTNIWNTEGDDRVRPSHDETEGQVRAEGEPFETGDGNLLMYPGDPDGPPEDTENCFPAAVLVAAPRAELAFRRWYEGPMAKIETASGRELTGTPNHPVLTRRGWCPLGAIEPGDEVVCCPGVERMNAGDPHEADGPTAIGEIHSAAALSDDVERHVVRSGDFHGDALTDGGQVEAVAIDRPLRLRLDAALREHRPQLVLASAGEGSRPAESSGSGPGGDAFGWVDVAAARVVRGCSESGAALRPLTIHADSTRGGTAAPLDAGCNETPRDRGAVDTEGSRESEFGFPGDVATDEIVHVEVSHYVGHVFNLQTGPGWYAAEGIVVHNCRCFLLVQGEDWQWRDLPPDYPAGGNPEAIAAVLDQAASELEG